MSEEILLDDEQLAVVCKYYDEKGSLFSVSIDDYERNIAFAQLMYFWEWLKESCKEHQYPYTFDKEICWIEQNEKRIVRAKRRYYCPQCMEKVRSKIG